MLNVVQVDITLMTMNRWLYPPIGLVINLILGTIYSWSIFRIPLKELLQWTDLQVSLPFTAFLLSFAMIMPIGGKLIDKLGARLTALLGSILVGLGWLSAGYIINFPDPLVTMIIFYGLIAGAGVGIVYGVPITVSSRWIPERKGLAVGITITGFGLSPLITAPLARYLISTFGVLESFKYLGMAFIVILLICSLPLSLPRTSSSPSISNIQEDSYSPRKMLKTRVFYGLWTAYMLGMLGGFIAISISASYGVEILELSTELATIITAIFAVFNGSGRPLFGFICDKLGVRFTALFSFMLIFLASLSISLYHSPLTYITSFSILWLTFGGWLAIAPTATSTFFGVRNIGQNYGIVFTAYGFSALVGPPMAGYIKELTGVYQLAFIATAILSILGLIIVLFTFRERSLEKIGSDIDNLNN